MTIPGSANPLLLGAAAGASGYQISRSLRFNSSDSAYLSRTPASAGNRKTWTWAGWVKRSAFSRGVLFASTQNGSNLFALEVNSDKLDIYDYAFTFQWRLNTTAVFRDPSAWMHICFALDATQATSANRAKLYINGAQVSTFDTASYPSLDYQGFVNTTNVHDIGSYGGGTGFFFNGYLADIHFIDGQALDPTSFGEFSATTGVWMPKAYTGTYGTNGFKLNFSDNSTTAALGTDTSGNGNDWTPNNLIATPAARQGYKGGDSYQYAGGNAGGGGGGGAGGPGANGVSGVSAGAGGVGRQSSITGSATYYGGGGGGGSWGTAGGAGGLGGGGAGKLGGSSTGPANPGTNGLGGGGGGAGYSFTDWQAGGSGGSGRVVIRYPSSYGVLSASAGGSLSTVGSDYVYQWTSVGSATITFPTGSTIPVQYLVVGGGGGAESGGGGGGGVLEGTLSVLSGSTQTITVGGGGNGASPYPSPGAATNGGNSVFSSVIALGGGRGAGGDSGAAATSGGSGGGGGTTAGITAGGAGTGDSQSDIDSLVDVPTNGSEVDTGLGGQVRGNYCTLNPLAGKLTATLTDGNLTRTGTVGNNRMGTVGMSSGKWYWEVLVENVTATTFLGVTTYVSEPDNYAENYVYNSSGGKYIGLSLSSYGSSYGVGDIISLAYDADTGTLTAYKNNVSQGVLVSGISKTAFALSRTDGTGQHTFNFGQRPFAYTAPSGFKALCTANLPAPVVTKASDLFDVKLWNGNSGTQNITGLGFSPDLVWVKGRVGTLNHVLADTVRGANLKLASNTTGAEAGTDNGTVSAFNSDGFTVAMGGGAYPGYETNLSGYSYAGWCWDAGNATVTDNTGSIQSTRRTNASAGFSVVSYTGNRTAGATVGHGLGVAPSLIIVKSRASGGFGWRTYHSSLGPTKTLKLNLTDAEEVITADWNNTAPTGTVFSLGTTAGGNYTTNDTVNYVAYCFAPVAGYSSFGSYTGNGSADGPFVFTGFRIKCLWIKETSGTGNWLVWDVARSSFNVMDDVLLPNSSSAEITDPSIYIDVVSNGFKIRSTSDDYNGNSGTYIYCAWAESPFQYARAR